MAATNESGIAEIIKHLTIVAYKNPLVLDMCYVEARIGDFVIISCKKSSYRLGEKKAFELAEKEVKKKVLKEIERLEDYRLAIELINGWSGEVN